MSANGYREMHDPLEDAVLAAMVASGWAETEDVQAAFDALDAEIEAERILCACGDEITLDHYGDGVRCPNCLVGDKPTREQAIAWVLEGEPAPSVLAWGDVPDDEPTSPMLMPLDDIEGNGRGPT